MTTSDRAGNEERLRKALVRHVNETFCKYDASVVGELLDQTAALAATPTQSGAEGPAYEPDSALARLHEALDDWHNGELAIAFEAVRALRSGAEVAAAPGLDYGESRETLTTDEVAARLDETPLIVGRLALGEPIGACMRACLATITGLDIAPTGEGSGWFEQYQTRLSLLGWVLESSPPTRPVVGFSIAIGPSPTGDGDHAMVALDGVVIWDPATGLQDSGDGFVPRSFCPVYQRAAARLTDNPS